MSFITKFVGDIAEGLGLIDKPKAPPPPPPAPTLSSADVQNSAEAERKRLAAMQGKASTILTDPLGASNNDPLSASKTLFGS